MAEPFLPAFGLSGVVAEGLREAARHFTASAAVLAQPDGSIDGRSMQGLLITAFGQVKAKFELPLAERLYLIALKDFPRASQRHLASAWLTIALPLLAQGEPSGSTGIREVIKQKLQAAIAEYQKRMLPWNMLLEKTERITPTAWDASVCAPGAFYGNPPEEFRPVDWLWDAIRWVHFRIVWHQIEDQLSVQQLQEVLMWANNAMTERGLPLIEVPTF